MIVMALIKVNIRNVNRIDLLAQKEAGNWLENAIRLRFGIIGLILLYKHKKPWTLGCGRLSTIYYHKETCNIFWFELNLGFSGNE